MISVENGEVIMKGGFLRTKHNGLVSSVSTFRCCRHVHFQEIKQEAPIKEAS
ncbi:MAG: hypothetical protein RR330_04355 [Alistipes sp.]